MDDHQNLLDIIKILKDYYNKSIVDKYIDDNTDEYGNHHLGYRGNEHPDNIYKEITKIINNYSSEECNENCDDVIDICNKFFEFLDMAGNFYYWNGDLNSFKVTIYFGASPNSNKQAVIDNWKNYRKQSIEIDDSKYKKDDDNE